MVKTIFIASDHAGYDAKEKVKQILDVLNYKYEDLGTHNSTTSVDYPTYANKVAQNVLKNNSKGILICGSGTGMQIAANKIKGIRAAFAFDKYSAQMARIDNNANILTLRGREFNFSKYEKIVKTFLETKFSKLERHKKRIKLLDEMEN